MKKDAAKDIKIAFFDVDGTLVDMEKKIISPKMEKEWNYFMHCYRTRSIHGSDFSGN